MPQKIQLVWYLQGRSPSDKEETHRGGEGRMMPIKPHKISTIVQLYNSFGE